MILFDSKFLIPKNLTFFSLNPCFSGWYSLMDEKQAIYGFAGAVLILVLVDDTLWYYLHHDEDLTGQAS